MKTQNFGDLGYLLRRARGWVVQPPLRLTLKNYRENRENGNQQDNPKSAFPSYGLENIEDYSDFNKSFSVESDKQRGSPEKFTGPDGKQENRYWYLIKHKSSGTVMAGFSYEPAFKKDSNGYDLYLYKFTDTHCPAIRQWMEEKDLNYLRRIQRENPALYQKEIKELKAANPHHPAIQQLDAQAKQLELELQAKEREAAEQRKQEEIPQRLEMERRAKEAWQGLLALATPVTDSRALPSPYAMFQPAPLPPLPPQQPTAIQMRAAYAYQTTQPGYLSFVKGDVLTVLSKNEGGWWLCERGLEQGLAPSNYLAPLPMMSNQTDLPSGFINNFARFMP